MEVAHTVATLPAKIERSFTVADTVIPLLPGWLSFLKYERAEYGRRIIADTAATIAN